MVLVPHAQAQVESSCFCDTQVATSEDFTFTPILHGIYLAEIHQDYTDFHLWYKVFDKEGNVVVFPRVNNDPFRTPEEVQSIKRGMRIDNV